MKILRLRIQKNMIDTYSYLYYTNFGNETACIHKPYWNEITTLRFFLNSIKFYEASINAYVKLQNVKWFESQTLPYLSRPVHAVHHFN